MKKATMLLGSLGVLLLFGPALPARADTFTVCDTIPRVSFRDVSFDVTIPAFPYPDCYLISADAVLNVSIDGQFFGENTGNCIAPGCAWYDSIYASVSLNDLDGSPLADDFSFTDGGLLQSYDGTFDFAGPSGYTSPFAWAPFNDFHMTFTDLSIFANPVIVPIQAHAFTSLTSPGNGSFNVSTFIQGTLCVTYEYACPTAVEPVSWGTIKALYK